MLENRRFERLNDKIACKSYVKREDVLENKEIFVHVFKHIQTDEIDTYILIGCKSDEIFENDKLFIFWSNNHKNEEIEKRDFKIT